MWEWIQDVEKVENIEMGTGCENGYMIVNGYRYMERVMDNGMCTGR